MIGFTENGGILHADAVPLQDIAAQAATPCYVYSAGKIKQSAHALQSAFAGILPSDRQPLIVFACKANSNLAVMRLLGSMGLGADIVSGGELLRARRARIPRDKIVFSGVGKTDDEILDALKTEILQINVESAPELEHIATLAAQLNVKAPVALRINPDVDAKTHAKITTGKTENKFGIPQKEAEVLYGFICSHPHLRPRGLSMHIGSQLTVLEPFQQAFEKMAELGKKIISKGWPLESLDIGGGLGVLYNDETRPDVNAYATLVRDIIAPLNTQIILEPGRYLVGESGILLSKVIFVKEGENRRYLILDSGMNDLMRPALYDAWHSIRPVDNTAKRPATTYDVVGPVCETGDTFAKGRSLPEMKAGELVAVMTGGAYGFVMASNYNTRALPAEVLVDGDRFAIVRPRETIEDIIGRESIPDWMS